MRILLINFLRLGDILMMSPIVNALRRKYPGAQFHHLGFKEFSIAEEVMEQVDCWHYISRKELLHSCRDATDGLLSPADLIESKCRELTHFEFDLVISLSHTTFSSICAGLVQGKRTLGAYVDGDELKFSTSNFERINQHESLDRHHYLDWFRLGLEMTNEPVDWSFQRIKSPVGTDRRSSLTDGRRVYLIQTLSSDEKKAWSMERWLELFALIRRRDPFAEIKLLCAPFEREHLATLAEQADAELLSVGLKEAHSAIQKADFFITLDTSTKHLSNDSKCKVIELCLGSSDHRKQSIYRAGSVILTPRDECYPCSPRDFCPKVQRSCLKGIAPSDVISAIEFSEGKEKVSFSCGAFVTTSDQLWACEEITGRKGGEIERSESGKPTVESHSEA